MLIIGSLWWLWLVILGSALVYSARIQYLRAQMISRNIGHTVTNVLSGDPKLIGESAQRLTNDFTSGFFGGLWRLGICVVVAAVSGILLITSLIIQFANYFQGLS